MPPKDCGLHLLTLKPGSHMQLTELKTVTLPLEREVYIVPIQEKIKSPITEAISGFCWHAWKCDCSSTSQACWW